MSKLSSTSMGIDALVNMKPGTLFKFAYVPHNSVFTDPWKLGNDLFMVLWTYESTKTEAHVGVMRVKDSHVTYGDPQTSGVIPLT